VGYFKNGVEAYVIPGFRSAQAANICHIVGFGPLKTRNRLLAMNNICVIFDLDGTPQRLPGKRLNELSAKYIHVVNRMTTIIATKAVSSTQSLKYIG